MALRNKHRYESVKAVADLMLSDGMGISMDEEEIEMQISSIREKFESKLEKERTQNRITIDYLKDQIAKKDKRIDYLMKVNELLIYKLFGLNIDNDVLTSLFKNGFDSEE